MRRSCRHEQAREVEGLSGLVYGTAQVKGEAVGPRGPAVESDCLDDDSVDDEARCLGIRADQEDRELIGSDPADKVGPTHCVS